MNTKPTGGSAFPVSIGVDKLTNTLTFDCATTLRDYFAAAALNGLLSDAVNIASVVNVRDELKITGPQIVATMCYDYADAMLKARDQC